MLLLFLWLFYFVIFLSIFLWWFFLFILFLINTANLSHSYICILLRARFRIIRYGHRRGYNPVHSSCSHTSLYGLVEVSIIIIIIYMSRILIFILIFIASCWSLLLSGGGVVNLLTGWSSRSFIQLDLFLFLLLFLLLLLLEWMLGYH